MARKILTEHINVPGIETFDVYRKQGGYTAVEKAIKTMTPEEVVKKRKNQACAAEVGQASRWE
jgi:NADH-quinone oxidoreductase subunit F